jgi:hypothetical protein
MLDTWQYGSGLGTLLDEKQPSADWRSFQSGKRPRKYGYSEWRYHLDVKVLVRTFAHLRKLSLLVAPMTVDFIRKYIVMLVKYDYIDRLKCQQNESERFQLWECHVLLNIMLPILTATLWRRNRKNQERIHDEIRHKIKTEENKAHINKKDE